jgi:hypothetical protein
MIVESQIKLATPNSAWRSIGAIDLADGQTYSTANGIGELLPEKTEIRQKLIFSGTNGEVSSIIHGYLINNDVGI